MNIVHLFGRVLSVRKHRTTLTLSMATSRDADSSQRLTVSLHGSLAKRWAMILEKRMTVALTGYLTGGRDNSFGLNVVHVKVLAINLPRQGMDEALRKLQAGNLPQ